MGGLVRKGRYQTEADTEDGCVKIKAEMDAATSPGTPEPQELDKAGRTLPWSLQRELGPATPSF